MGKSAVCHSHAGHHQLLDYTCAHIYENTKQPPVRKHIDQDCHFDMLAEC